VVVRIFGLRGYVSKSSESSHAMHKKRKAKIYLVQYLLLVLWRE
jgi:hypothetical protein